MSRALIVLDTEFQRRKAADWVWSLKHGTRVEFKAPKRSDDQNSLMWVLLTKISVSLKWHGRHLTPDDWKLQFLDALRRVKNEELRIVPNIDNTGFVNLSTSSSDLSKDEMSDLIELIYKFGAEHGVDLSQSDAPTSEGSDESLTPPEAVAAEPVPAAADQEAGEPEADHGGAAVPASYSLSPSDKEFLVRVFKTMKAAVGPDVDVFTNQAKIFSEEAAGKPLAVKAKATKIRTELARCCGEKPETGTVAVAKYVAALIGVEVKELEG